MINAVGAHIYAGGFTLGVAQHFNVLGHLEHEAYGSEVVKLNFPDLPIYAGGPSHWPTRWPRGADRVRFMYANPPCAIWSVSTFYGTNHDWRDDPRLQLHHDIFNYAMDVVAPDVLVIESVPPSFTKGREHFENLMERAQTYGYASTTILHDTQWLGVPQRRQRVFYAFHKVAIPWDIPDFGPPVTVRQAFKGLPRKSAGYPDPPLSKSLGHWLSLTQPGGSLEKVFKAHNPDPVRDAKGWRTGAPSTLARRLPWDKPAPVVLYPFHPTENRRLRQEEIAAVCSFPPDYRWPKAGCNTVAGWANRGIMPKAAEWLARGVHEGLVENKRLNDLEPKVFDVVNPPGSYYTLPSVTQIERGPNVARAAQISPPAYPPLNQGEGSGSYIRRLLQMGSYDTDTIVTAVHAQFPESRTTKADVSWNKGQLKKQAMAAAAAAPVVVEKRRGRPPGIKV